SAFCETGEAGVSRGLQSPASRGAAAACVLRAGGVPLGEASGFPPTLQCLRQRGL
ncbi:unnamed protein product, partial [Polarella glacialis]